MKIFKEEQRFTQTWLIVLMGFSLIVPLVLTTREFLNENSGFSVGGYLSVIGILLVSIVPIFFFKLTTRIDEVGIHYQFFPFHFNRKKITWQEIEKAYVKTYDPIGDYGGWGLKGGFLWNKSKGTAINVSGDIGIQLELKKGKKILIGTQKEQEAKNVLQTYINKDIL